MLDRSTATPSGTRQPRTARPNTVLAPVPPAAAAQAEEALRRVRPAAATPAQSTPVGQRMAQRSHSRTLAAAIEQLVIAALPHVDNALTAPMVEVQLHTPGADGELIASFQLPKQIADTITVAMRSVTSAVVADNAEHSRTADTGPAPAARRLSVLPGGVA